MKQLIEILADAGSKLAPPYIPPLPPDEKVLTASQNGRRKRKKKK